MPDGEHKGGTAIVIPLDAIERKADETRDPAVKRIRQSAYRSRDGRLTTVDILLNEKSTKVACAYAPQDGTRPAFLTGIKDKINSSTALALDANCVPDTNLDLKRDARTPYDNAGSQELKDVVDHHDLARTPRASTSATTASSPSTRGSTCS